MTIRFSVNYKQSLRVVSLPSVNAHTMIKLAAVFLKNGSLVHLPADLLNEASISERIAYINA